MSRVLFLSMAVVVACGLGSCQDDADVWGYDSVSSDGRFTVFVVPNASTQSYEARIYTYVGDGDPMRFVPRDSTWSTASYGARVKLPLPAIAVDPTSHDWELVKSYRLVCPKDEEIVPLDGNAGHVSWNQRQEMFEITYPGGRLLLSTGDEFSHY